MRFSIRNKYRAKPVTLDGIRFDSQAEAARYAELKMLQRGKLIDRLEVHPKCPLHARTGKEIGHYVADFRYWDCEAGCEIIEDVKSPATAKNALYRWKKRHFEIEYRTTVTEVFRK